MLCEFCNFCVGGRPAQAIELSKAARVNTQKMAVVFSMAGRTVNNSQQSTVDSQQSTVNSQESGVRSGEQGKRITGEEGKGEGVKGQGERGRGKAKKEVELSISCQHSLVSNQQSAIRNPQSGGRRHCFGSDAFQSPKHVKHEKSKENYWCENRRQSPPPGAVSNYQDTLIEVKYRFD